MKSWLVVALLAGTAAARPDPSVIRHVIRTRQPEVRACYERELAKHPALEGTVTVTFTIDRTGHVRDSTATGLANVDTCVAGVIQTLVFPAPAKELVINYPFVFKPD